MPTSERRRRAASIVCPCILTVERRRGGGGLHYLVTFHTSRPTLSGAGLPVVDERYSPRRFVLGKPRAIPGNSEGLELLVLQVISDACDRLTGRKDGDMIMSHITLDGELDFRDIREKAGG